MAAYAPIAGHDTLRTWHTTLLVTDDLRRWYGTPSYTAQRLLRDYAGTRCIQITRSADVIKGNGASSSSSRQAVAATCRDSACRTIDIKIVNFARDAASVALQLRLPQRVQRSLVARMALWLSRRSQQHEELKLHQPAHLVQIFSAVGACGGSACRSWLD